MIDFIDIDRLIRARDAAMATVEGMREGRLKESTYETVLAELIKRALSHDSHDLSVVDQAGAITAKKAGTTDRILGLLSDGFFAQPKSLTEIRKELAERGFHYRLEDIGTPLTRLVQRKRLRRNQGMVRGKKKWMYANY